jgi:hypothetical protein
MFTYNHGTSRSTGGFLVFYQGGVVDNSSNMPEPIHSTLKSYWVEGHAENGPPHSPQEELNILTDGIAGKAQTSLTPTMKPHSDCLYFPEQHIAIVTHQIKVTSHLTYIIYNAIYGLKLTKYLSATKKSSVALFQSMA